MSWGMHPLKEGDRVIDDNGEFGHVLKLICLTTNHDGSIQNWSATIRYDYDQDSYGVTRNVQKGEVFKILPDGRQISI